MLKANELRIGNWVASYGEPVQVVAIDVENNIHPIRTTPNNIGATHGGFYEPIPLTPEILEKCGFVDGRITHDSEVYELIISGHPDAVGFPCLCRTYTTGNFDRIAIAWSIIHLHQLQNLFYALTGEELSITL